MYACLYRPSPAESGESLAAIAAGFSPRYECHREDLVVIDVRGLERLIGPSETIGAELRRTASARGVLLHVAVGATQTAALLLAQAHPGMRVGDRRKVAVDLAPVSIGLLGRMPVSMVMAPGGRHAPARGHARFDVEPVLAALRTWGIGTLGRFAALPAKDVAARLGRAGVAWQAIARGEDGRPLCPTLADERFEAALELEWPIEGAEPLSFVLTRLLEPLSTRLERRDRGAAALHLALDLVTREVAVRRIDLPSPIRDVRTLRTLALLALESQPPGAAIDRVAVTIEPTPGRVLQHALFTRAQPTPEQLSTLLARLGALLGQDRIGAPASVDAFRPGAFAQVPFATTPREADRAEGGAAMSAGPLVSALRRYRRPVPARVVVEQGRPVRVTTDRRGCASGPVTGCAGPWRVTGEWWRSDRYARDEWDVALGDGGVYRIFRDATTGGWFVDALVD